MTWVVQGHEDINTEDKMTPSRREDRLQGRIGQDREDMI